MKQPLSIIVQLVHIHGPMKGRIQEFGGSEIAIGRHPSCDLQFPKDLVVISRNHARIIREGNRFKIVDSSTNGTFVNGTRITETWLKNGDVIFFTEGGPKISFLTREGEIAPAPEPRPSVPEAVVLEPPPLQEPPQPDSPVDENLQPPVTPAMPARPTPQSSPPQPVFSQEPPVPPPPPVQPPAQQTVQPPPSQSPGPEPRAETVKAPLVIQYGAVLKSFNELPITMGSLADCDFILEHPAVSGPQVQIYFSQGSYRVKDLTGRNQMRINGRETVSPSPLMPGDRLFLTPGGPGFQFIEGGRMAEISLPPQEEPEYDESPREIAAAPAKEKSNSLFKKLFR